MENCKTRKEKEEYILIFTTKNFAKTSKEEEQILSNMPGPSQDPREVVSNEWRKQAVRCSLNVNTSVRGALNSIINFYVKRHAASRPLRYQQFLLTTRYWGEPTHAAELVLTSRALLGLLVGALCKQGKSKDKREPRVECKVGRGRKRNRDRNLGTNKASSGDASSEKTELTLQLKWAGTAG